jgi:hypothetical protein
MKKAQFFLLGVIAICVIVFVLLSIKPEERYRAKQIDVFEKLWQNFYKESVFVVDQAVSGSNDIFPDFQNFTDDFKIYSKNIDSSFGFVYVLTDSSHQTKIMNELESDANVLYTANSSSDTLAKGSYVVKDTPFVNITINNNEYHFDTEYANMLHLLFYEKKADSIRIKQVN